VPIVKRSLTLKGHRTSVSLESEFWEAFRASAATRAMSLNALASEIDAAIRLYVLAELQERLKAAEAR